jgi:hypothetical protein
MVAVTVGGILAIALIGVGLANMLGWRDEAKFWRERCYFWMRRAAGLDNDDNDDDKIEPLH